MENHKLYLDKKESSDYLSETLRTVSSALHPAVKIPEVHKIKNVKKVHKRSQKVIKYLIQQVEEQQDKRQIKIERRGIPNPQMLLNTEETWKPVRLVQGKVLNIYAILLQKIVKFINIVKVLDIRFIP